MKKTLVATILGLAAVASTFAQGRLNLNTYASAPYPLITYGQGSGGTQGQPVSSATPFNVGFYWLAGNQLGSIAADPSGFASISAIAPTFSLATGGGSSATINTGGSGVGWFATTGGDYTFAGVAAGDVSLIIVAFNGATYESSLVRGHSGGFLLTPAQGLSTAPGVGAMPTFAVSAVPEPSTFALAGLGLASLLIFRRRK